MSMYDKNHYNTVISLQLIKIKEKKQFCVKTFNKHVDSADELTAKD